MGVGSEVGEDLKESQNKLENGIEE